MTTNSEDRAPQEPRLWLAKVRMPMFEPNSEGVRWEQRTYLVAATDRMAAEWQIERYPGLMAMEKPPKIDLVADDVARVWGPNGADEPYEATLDREQPDG